MDQLSSHPQENLPQEDVVPESPWEYEIDDLLFEDDETLQQVSSSGEDGDATPRITVDDFDSPEVQFIFQAVRKHLRDASNVNTQQSKREPAVRWVFTRNLQDKDGLDFLHCVEALGARHFVVQARLLHQMWRAGVAISRPMDILCDGLPGTLASEIEARIRPGLPVEMSRHIWSWPGMPALHLRQMYSHLDLKTYTAVIKDLEANGYIGISGASFYFISRNTDLMPLSYRRVFSFARSIIGDF
jgi:hypothetical protein